MTTPNIEELMGLAEAYAWHSVHGAETNGESVVGAKDALHDALQSQAERIKELEAEVERVLKLHDDALAWKFSLIEERDTIRAQLAAMQVDDELPEPVARQFYGSDFQWLNFLDDRHYENTLADGGWEIRDLFTADQLRQAQSMVRAKMVPLEKDAGRYGHLMAYHIHQIAPMFGVSFGSYTPALETITKVSAAIDTARGITGEPK